MYKQSKTVLQKLKAKKRSVLEQKVFEEAVRQIASSSAQTDHNLTALKELYNQFELATGCVLKLKRAKKTLQESKDCISNWFNYYIGLRDEFCLVNYGGGFNRNIVEGRNGKTQMRDLSTFQHVRDKHVKNHTPSPLENVDFVVSCSVRGLYYLLNDFEVKNRNFCSKDYLII